MQPARTLEDLRTAFREAYEEYIREGLEMRDLLVNASAPSEPERLEAIKICQKRVDDAKQKYESARTAYVSYVLSTLAGSGGTLL